MLRAATRKCVLVVHKHLVARCGLFLRSVKRIIGRVCAHAIGRGRWFCGLHFSGVTLPMVGFASALAFRVLVLSDRTGVTGSLTLLALEGANFTVGARRGLSRVTRSSVALCSDRTFCAGGLSGLALEASRVAAGACTGLSRVAHSGLALCSDRTWRAGGCAWSG